MVRSTAKGRPERESTNIPGALGNVPTVPTLNSTAFLHVYTFAKDHGGVYSETYSEIFDSKGFNSRENLATLAHGHLRLCSKTRMPCSLLEGRHS